MTQENTHDEAMEPEHVAPALDLGLIAQLERYLPIVSVKRKVIAAAADMARRVRIDDTHNYTRTTDGKWLPGVTSVSGLVPKDWLSAWRAKEAVKFLGFSDFPEDTETAMEMLARIASIGQPLIVAEAKEEPIKKALSQYLTLLKEAKGASARKSKEALVDGKAGHAWIESYIKSKINGEVAPAIPDGKSASAAMLKRPIMQFLAWEHEHVALWILSEAIVCDTEREYAGTLDAVAIMQDGTLAIVDAKFASHISPEYALQTAGYAATFERYGILFDKRIIVRLPKTLEKPEWDKAAKKYVMVENTIEVQEIQSDYAWDRDVFYSALPVKKWVNANVQR